MPFNKETKSNQTKETSLPYYLPIAIERKDGFVPFLIELDQSETHPAFEFGTSIPISTTKTIKLRFDLEPPKRQSVIWLFPMDFYWKICRSFFYKIIPDVLL